jgi:DeoR/GlpR family transcriptional regulator of sugar metabolism
MFAEERYRLIAQAVGRNGKATVAELSDMLGVTAVTIRRDLEKLEERGVLLRTHGGAISLPQGAEETAHERTFAEKAESFAAEKERIATAAADMVGDEEAVLLTPGSTNTLLFRRLEGKRDVTVVTNAANLIVPRDNDGGPEVVLLGGVLRQKSYAMVGPLTEQALAHFRVDKLFLGIDGFDLTEGLTTPNMAEASVNRKMIDIAKQVIVVADHSKFGKVFFAHVASVDTVHTVITDSGIADRTAEEIREQGIKLIIV